VLDYRTKVWWLAMYADILSIVSNGEGRPDIYYAYSR